MSDFEEEPGRDEDPPQKIYLLNCGHFGIKQFYNGEEFCQQCFDEYYELCKEVTSPEGKLADVNNLKPEDFGTFEDFKNKL